MTDTVFIEKPDGRRLGPYKGVLSKSQFTIMDKTLDVDHGDLLVRPLPNGKEEHYTVLRADFREDFHAIPGGYDLSINKKQQIHSRPSSIVNNVSISNSSGFQVGNRNLQSVPSSTHTTSASDRVAPGKADKAATIDAIHALIESIEGGSHG